MTQKKALLLIAFIAIWSSQKLVSQIVASQTAGCAPLSVQFSGPSGATNVFWNLGVGIGTSTLNTPNPIYSSAGSYNVTYTAIVGGLPVSYSKQITVYAKPNASFSYVIPSTHCAPLTASFTGSGGSPGSTYSWAFGDLQVNLNTVSSVTHTYNSAGAFAPIMVVADALTGCTAVAVPSSPTVINVSSPPQVNFTSSNGYVGCTPPFITSFTGTNSVSGSPIPGPLTVYNWQFGLASPPFSSIPSSVTVSFGSGFYTMSLTVTDNNQCSNTKTAQVTVVTPVLTASIQPTVCVNEAVTSTVLSSQPLTNWGFSGVAAPSATVRPVTVNTVTTLDSLVIFSTGGLKNYTVTINNGPQCPQTVLTNTVFVEAFTFSYTPVPQYTSCSSPFTISFVPTFTINSSSAVSFTWLATAGSMPYNQVSPNTATTTLSTSPGPAQVFTLTQGNYNPYTLQKSNFSFVALFAQTNSIAQCKLPKMLRINDFELRVPFANFYKNKKEGCVPLTVQFVDSSLSIDPITHYTLFYGTPANNSATFTTAFFYSYFTYTAPGVYTPSLTIQTLGGCTDVSFVDTIVVTNPPTVNASILNPNVCAGVQEVTVTLSGTPSNPPGSPFNNIQHWHVDSDLGYFSGCVTNSNPSYPFNHVGTFPVTVSAYQNGCVSAPVTLAQQVTARGPYGKFRYETQCAAGSRKDVTFTVTVEDAQSATLDFGDNSPPQLVTCVPNGTTTLSYQHSYLATGNYTAKLVSYNPPNSCPNFTYTQVVTIREPKANILFNGLPLPSSTLTSMACLNQRYNFTGSTSVDADVACGTGYKWKLKTPTYTMPTFQNGLANFGGPITPSYHHPGSSDTTIFDLAAKDTFRLAGNYTISLSVKDVNGCTDTDTRVFRISGAKPLFTLTPSPLCLSDSVLNVINATQASQLGNDAITNYTWTFGDGTFPLVSTNPTLNPVHTYTAAASPSQTFPVKCVAINSSGCRDSTEKVITVNNPDVKLGVSDKFPCLSLGQSTTITYTANTGFLTYSLSFGDPPGIPSWVVLNNINNVPHTFNVPGVYVASVTAKHPNGCHGIQQVTVNVIGQPTAGIGFGNNKNKYCLDDLLNASVFSTSSINITPITYYYWTFLGNTFSGTANGFTPSVTGPGVYTVALLASWYGYCASSVKDFLYVGDPEAEINLDKKTFCLGETIHANVKNPVGVYEWQWFFGDLVPQTPSVATSPTTISTYTVSYPYTIYPTSTTNGRTTVTLLYSYINNTCPRTSTVEIGVIKLDADFTTRDNLFRHCLGKKDEFINTTVDYFNLSYDYKWNLGNAGASTLPSPAVTFTSAGVYPVKMDIADFQYNCKASAIKNVTVLPLPSASLAVQDSACRDASFKIKGTGTPGVSGTVSGILKFGQDSLKPAFTAENSFSTTATATASAIYTLYVTDENGCVSPASVDSVYIQQRARQVNWDTTVVIGQPVPINAYEGSNFTYTWSPVVTKLSCINCYNPISTTTDNITYSVTTSDIFPGCFKTLSTYSIKIDLKSSLDVPTAFTPNGDGHNDVIGPAGWGLKKLTYFKVFNRWGQLLYETDDLKTGWDGNYQGTPQNMETYVYQVHAETFTNETLSKSGTFKLIR